LGILKRGASNMKKNAFTLIELLAVIVILGIILAVAVPSIAGIIDASTRRSFESDAKMVLKAIDYKKLENESFDPTKLSKSNVSDLLGLSSTNYNSISIIVENNIPIITLVGTGKWNGLVACGSFTNMKVVSSTSDCSTDLVPPVITMNGNNPVNIFVGETYTDAGATAVDDKDGDLTSKIATMGTVNPTMPGTYSITYTVADSSGNQTHVTRTINVIDNISPVVAFSPNGNITYAKSRTTVINVVDVSDINLNSLKYVWTASTDEPSSDLFASAYTNNQTITTPPVSGSYYLWVKASDAAGNNTTVRSNVFNLDNEPPVITLNGDASLTINRGSIYIDEGATASDNIDTNVVVTSIGSVNPSVVGIYTITYSASDASGNVAIPVTRTINVIDVLAPVITLNGSNPTNINVNGTYTDEGATAVDDVDGDVTSRIVVTGTVNPSVVGTYTITYTVKDNASNTSTKTRTVNVIDNIAPTITFGTNGNPSYSKSASSTISATDLHGTINTDSLKFLWSLNTTTPPESDFYTWYINGSSVTIPNGANGIYYLWAMAKDNAGNTTITRTNAFYLDNTAPSVPTVNLNGYTSGTWTNSNIAFTLSSSESGSGLYQYQYSVGGSAWAQTLGTNGWTYTWDANDSIVFRTVDNAGNVSASTSTYIFRRDASVPTYSSYEIKNVTSSGYDVYVYGVSDAMSGIARVQFPTWTEYNGQDDIQANWETNSTATGVNQGNGTWYYRVNVSSHNNESGIYNTHVWIYDNAGNTSAFATNQINVPPSVYYLVDVVNVGDFVSYTGNNGCTNCSGQSVSCYGGYANTYSGWRVLSKSGSGSTGTVTLVSAGTTMCIGSSTVETINGYATKYLNTTYATSARSINCNDALPYTSAACTNYTTYVSDSMIQPGGFYYFATATSPGGSVLWAIVESGRFNTNAGYTFGLRPVITLKSAIKKSGGSGTSTSPYTITP
jgi:prepilin-type N-terminal cleavage/methylation domain-containing protein